MGQRNVPLTEEGKSAAAKAARDLNNIHIDALFTSPLLRCIQTAEAFERALDLPMQVVKGLEERAWGIFEGRHKSERDNGVLGFGIEELPVFQARAFSALERIGRMANSPLIITHSGVIRVVLCVTEQAAIDVIPHLMPIAIPHPMDIR